MRKIFVIYNPAAGGKASKIIQHLQGFLKSQRISFHLEDTRQTRSATTSVEENLDSTFTDLIIIGGDGTINEAINGLAFDIPVSIIPAGTGDDFVKMIDIGKDMKEHIQTSIEGSISRIDLGLCNDRKFVNGVGIGFDGQIVEDMISKRVPLLKGHAAYYYHVLRILGGYREKKFDFQIEGKEYRKELILLTIGNGSTFGGGFKLMPAAQLNDGLLDVCEIGKLSSLQRFLNVGRLSNGTHGVLKAVKSYQARRISVQANPSLFAHIDGERFGNPPFDVKILPGALNVRVKV